jgi:hypothetical protein
MITILLEKGGLYQIFKNVGVKRKKVIPYEKTFFSNDIADLFISSKCFGGSDVSRRTWERDRLQTMSDLSQIG